MMPWLLTAPVEGYVCSGGGVVMNDHNRYWMSVGRVTTRGLKRTSMFGSSSFLKGDDFEREQPHGVRRIGGRRAGISYLPRYLQSSRPSHNLPPFWELSLLQPALIFLLYTLDPIATTHTQGCTPDSYDDPLLAWCYEILQAVSASSSPSVGIIGPSLTYLSRRCNSRRLYRKRQHHVWMPELDNPSPFGLIDRYLAQEYSQSGSIFSRYPDIDPYCGRGLDICDLLIHTHRRRDPSILHRLPTAYTRCVRKLPQANVYRITRIPTIQHVFLYQKE